MSDTTIRAGRGEIEWVTEQLHVALDAVPYSIHGRDGDWVDGGAEAVAAALVAGGWTPPTREHAAADMAHRDDLARDVAHEWAEKSSRDIGPPPVGVKLHAALDRLAAAYGTWQGDSSPPV